jgi:hypothetical protein
MTGEKKFNFERIPVDTVLKITQEAPVQNEPVTNEAGRLEEESETKKDWMDLASQVQQERDPTKMIHLVDQLIDALARNKGLQ